MECFLEDTAITDNKMLSKCHERIRSALLSYSQITRSLDNNLSTALETPATQPDERNGAFPDTETHNKAAKYSSCTGSTMPAPLGLHRDGQMVER